MKYLLSIAFVIVSTAADARSWQSDYPSCNVRQQREVQESGRNRLRDHIATRANVLQADISTASKARPIPAKTLRHLWSRVDQIRKASDRTAAKQGFLSAAERTTYDRRLDAVAGQLCR
ncbi:hypothetical protein [Sphingomonas montana]|uniref:hypothetical protein n=1 Tax=Sphingomonas montana TaxID=1843236 RepID=UPI00096BE863|nr:hypothetical protein [Sphingomonas montana]